MRANRSIVGLAGALLLAGWGCDGGGGAHSVSASTEEATVKGTVTVDGKPISEGDVTFDATNINRKNGGGRTAKIGADGSYSLKTFVGSNSVTVHGTKVDGDPRLRMNGKQVDVKDGENTIAIELP